LLTLNPINRLSFRLGWLLLSAGLIVYVLWRGRYSRYMWYGLGLCAMLILGWFNIGVRQITQEEMRVEYVRALTSYEDVGYLWGGEGRLGIDCSGLVRRGFIDTQLWLGLTHGDASAIVRAIILWWVDQSAASLSELSSCFTVPVMYDVTLNSVDYSTLLPGDIMVTSNGVHCMVYLGNREWINADPTAGKVFRATVPDSSVHWFIAKANISRWRLLAY
jgi:hypothetical protein